MPAACKVCAHPRHEEIDAALRAVEVSVPKIAQEYEVSVSALRRHKANHLDVPEKERRSRGRPRIEFDLEQVERLGLLQCTDNEIAAFFGCSRDTIANRKASDADFLDALEKGKDKGKISLRRAQWQSATNGNITMQIWLGKQYLGQADRIKSSMDANLNTGVLRVPDAMEAEAWSEVAKRYMDFRRKLTTGQLDDLEEGP